MAATPDYAFMLQTDYLYQGTYAIEVAGATIGTVWGVRNVIVPERFGTDNTPKPSPTIRAKSSDSDSDTTGTTIGVIAGIVFLVIVIIFLLCKRMSLNEKEKKKRAEAAATVVAAAPVATNHVYTQGHNQTEVLSNPGQATQYVVRPTGVPMAQVPGMNGQYQMNAAGQPHFTGVYPQMPGQPMYPTPQPAPIAISDARVIPPATTASPMWATPPPYQPVQNQMQHLQFSSHPRPNFVTSVGENDQTNNQQHEIKSGPDSLPSTSPQASSSASFTPGWEPQPWTPPQPSTRPTSSTVDPSTLMDRSLPPLPPH